MRIKFATIIICLAISSLGVSQQLLGHFDAQEIISVMPEAATAQLTLQQEGAALEKTLTEMATEFETKYKDFELNQANLSEAVRNDQLQSLQDLQERIAAFQQSAQQTLSMKEGELLEPIYEKLQSAVGQIAEEKGYTYIFNVSDLNTNIFWKNDSNDITNDIKRKLKL